MKKLRNTAGLGIFLCFLTGMNLAAQEKEQPVLMLALRHFTENNNIQYLGVDARLKADNQLQPAKNLVVRLFLDSTGSEDLIAQVKTDEKGTARSVIPVQLKQVWDASPVHKFIALARLDPKGEETTSELEITPARMEMDTVNQDGTRSVTARVLSLTGGTWTPAKDVEVKIGVERLGGSLKIGDDETYTTDSLGQVTGEFKLDSLPSGNRNGSITLVARVEDNDQFGNLLVRKTVPWGHYYMHISTFGQRSLAAARFRSPLWLSFMAFSIMAAVWGVIIYLIFQIFRIKREGIRSGNRKEEAVRAGQVPA